MELEKPKHPDYLSKMANGEKKKALKSLSAWELILKYLDLNETNYFG